MGHIPFGLQLRFLHSTAWTRGGRAKKIHPSDDGRVGSDPVRDSEGAARIREDALRAPPYPKPGDPKNNTGFNSLNMHEVLLARQIKDLQP